MNGTLVIDKPEGLTSHDVVSRVRRLVGTRRVGHAGTLDPFATGVLVVCVERATRLVQYLVGLDKQYIATVRMGFATDTQDLTGQQITALEPSKGVSLEELKRVVSDFTGSQLQLPPMFSAKKIAGERLYKAARAGREVERAPVAITIHSIDLIASDERDIADNEDGTRDFTMRVACSSGTYVRTLAADIGTRLGVGAHLRALRRVAVGHFNIAEARSLDQLEEAAGRGDVGELIVSPADTLRNLPSVRLDRLGVERASHGMEVALIGREASATRSEDWRLLDEEGALIGVGRLDPERGVIKPKVVLSPSN